MTPNEKGTSIASEQVPGLMYTFSVMSGSVSPDVTCCSDDGSEPRYFEKTEDDSVTEYSVTAVPS